MLGERRAQLLSPAPPTAPHAMNNALRSLALYAAATGLQVCAVVGTLAAGSAISTHLLQADCRAEAALALISADHCATR